MKNSLSYVIVPFILIFTSCQKFVEIDLPKNQIATAYVFEDSVNTNAAIAGIYVDMLQAFNLGFSSGGITAFTGLSSDELYHTANNQNQEFYAVNILPTNTTNLNLWTSAYKFIYEANACIEGIRNSNTLPENQKNLFLGEALTIRAFLYFNLTNLYGAVPLILTTDYGKNRLLSRTDEHEVYSQLIADLQSAKSLLPKTSNYNNTRAGHYAASALLARAYLYTKNYDAAREEASYVINSQRYAIEADLDDVFKVGSKEILWGFAPVYPGRETWEGYYFVPTSTTAVPTYVITDELLNSFDDNDLRKHNWMRINTNSGTDYPIPYKYKLNAMQTSVSERYSVLRLAEQYLIRAEAYAYLNEISPAEDDVNIIKGRAGLLPVSGNIQSGLIDLIQQERRREMMCEWGHRWFDLKRTGLIDETLAPIKPNWRPTARLFPIPQTEIDNNPNLSQNNGY
ncbi:RagB/SusD family nutrient uptake outer membrane protein [Olivibacter sp. 47]|uniref:RagB/SusD domain-containing protein n=1 Tax=Sphingobacterium sp. (strain 21) TaxID=743722 RepID=F4CF47_SPHS2|nr:RagB/SusD family nutrient uptake outer membrane protein [Olivibacter sp. 47]MDM8174107.1 RagB/SusD family nutrient uptake outer membrane protein [Olivibacter sp. 47]